jgi:hypothetical protein
MKHLKKNNETYFSHFKFAGAMGLQLLVRGIAFILHGLLPVCEMPKSIDLNNTCELITKWNSHAKSRRRTNR